VNQHTSPDIALQMPEGMTTETARKVEQAMHYVQKPVIVQVRTNAAVFIAEDLRGSI